MTEQEKEALDGITFRIKDDGSVEYMREDGKPLTTENKEGVEKFLFHMSAVEQSIVSFGDDTSPSQRRCMILNMTMDLLGLDGDRGWQQ